MTLPDHLKRGISQQQQAYPILKEIADGLHFTRVDLARRCNQTTPDKSTT